MKRKRPEIIERRRPLLDMNLIAETKGRLATRKRGCLPFLTVLSIGFAVATTVGLGLH